MNGHRFRMFYEDYVRQKLAEYWEVPVSKILHLSIENPISDYDLLFGKLKIDIKTSTPVIVRKNRKAIWDFSLRKLHQGKKTGQNNECDYFALLAIKNGIPKSIYLVPSYESQTNHIRISLTGNSKYEKYKIF